MSKKSWGSDIIDKKNWIDPTKKYKCGGKPVENIVIKLTNSCGNEVTYPVTLGLSSGDDYVMRESKDPALALFWAIYKVMEASNED